MLRILISRAVLVALPFVIYFVWRNLALRAGRPMGATPWAWLSAAAAVLVGLSLMATVAFKGDNRRDIYVPAEAHPGGGVTPGRFEAR
ncbi:MAG: DUF6111 family protein [Caulobacteraceae bacterium]